MQLLSQNRISYRILLLGLLVAILLLVSWWLAPANHSAYSISSLDNFAGDTSLRTSASTDAQIQKLQDQLRSHPDDWQAYTQLGLVYLQKVRETGDPTYYQKTQMALEKALSFQPGDYASVAAKGALALARHDFASALELGQEAQKLNPNRTYAYGVIADAQNELGRYADAVTTLQTMVNLRPDISSYSRISYLRELYGDVPGAIEMMHLAVDSGTPNSENTAWVRTQLGNLYFNKGDLEQAEVQYQRTLQDRPNYVYALAGLGRVRAAQGNMKEAIELLNQAIGVMPMPEFVITLGDLYQTTGQAQAANQQYQLLATIEKLYRANGVDMDMEIALFDSDHHRHLEETVSLARQAYAKRPSIQGADVLAWALYQTGNYEEAQKYSKEALRLNTKDALKYFHAGMIALELGDKLHARQYLEQALAINPHFSILYAAEAQRTLQTLK